MGRGTRYPNVERILREHYAQKGGKVLEIAAGGAVYKDIFRDYIGTDLPANPYSQKGDLDVYCDAQHLPFKENIFDMCFIVAALYQIKDTDLVLSEVNRVLKLDGLFLVFDYNRKTTKRLRATENKGNNFNHVWSPWELKRTIQKAGFRAQIVKYSYGKSRRLIFLIKIASTILYPLRNLFFEGWNIIAAAKTGQVKQ